MTVTQDVDAACSFLADIATQIEGMTPADLIEFREAHEHFDGLRKIKKAVELIEAEILMHFCNAKEEVTFDGNVYYPTRTKVAEKWDGPALASLCAARATDFYWNPETGEAVPPVVLSTRIVDAVVKCLGGLAPSTSWRVTALASEFGIDKATVARYRSSEPGNPKIGSRPVQVGDVAA